MNKTKRDIERLAKRLGADLIVNNPAPELDCELVAPAGHHWKGEDVHSLVGCQDNWDTAGEVWEDVYHRALDGVEVCDRDTCSSWHNNECDFWHNATITN